MNFKEFWMDFGSYVSKTFQAYDYEFCLIEALKSKDEATLKALSNFARVAGLKSVVPEIRILEGAFPQESSWELKGAMFIQFFTILEVTLQHFMAAIHLDKTNSEISETSFILVENNSFNSLLLFYMNEEFFNKQKQLFERFRLYEDIRNCLAHNRGKITKNRRLLISKGYSLGDSIKIDDYDPRLIQADLLLFFKIWDSSEP